MTRPATQGHGNPIMRYWLGVPRVYRLPLWRGPAAILWAVWAVIVYAVNAVALWALSHIAKESFE